MPSNKWDNLWDFKHRSIENCLLRVVVRKQFLRSVAYAPELEGLLRLVKPASYIIHGWIQLLVMPRNKTKVCPIIQLKVELSTIRSTYCFVCTQNFENPSVAFWAKACNLKKAVQLRLLLFCYVEERENYWLSISIFRKGFYIEQTKEIGDASCKTLF